MFGAMVGLPYAPALLVQAHTSSLPDVQTAGRTDEEDPQDIGWDYRTNSAEKRSECRARHADLLQPISSELAHLKKRGINASSLDQLHWPSFSARLLDEQGIKQPKPFFQIHQGGLYAHRDSFLVTDDPSHNRENWGDFVEQLCGVLRTVPDLPPMRFMVHEKDRTEEFDDLPVFVPWKVKGSTPINAPSKKLDLDANAQHQGKEPAWTEKIPKAFFAGTVSDDDANKNFTMTHGKRTKLLELFDHDPESRELLDVHVRQHNAGHHIYSFVEEATRKYQLVMDGEAARSSFSAFLSMHSVVFKPYSPYYEFFEPALVAYEHFVPINLTDGESSKWDLKAQILWARGHDAIAQRIADSGSRFARQHLDNDGPKCYFLELLSQYHELMNFDDSLPFEFASSPDICSLPVL